MCLIFLTFRHEELPSVTIKQGGYVVATYDKCWYIVCVAEIDINKRDAEVNFCPQKDQFLHFTFQNTTMCAELPLGIYCVALSLQHQQQPEVNIRFPLQLLKKLLQHDKHF